MIGTTFSHYRILSELGRGGMGVVYKAQDTVLERTVALKVMRADLLGEQPAYRARFLQEARSAASLSHPNIATIFEANEVDGTMFIAMEFIEGASLRTLLEAPLPHDRALRIAIDVASGLAHAHEQRVVHRDLKPENVLVARDGTAKILDFGLAKVLAEQSNAGNETLAGGATATAIAGLTQHGQIMGTPAYMSPEQARGLEVDFRTDQFAFGVLSYELLTGEAPFTGPTTVDTLSAVLNAHPVSLNTRDASLPPQLDRIVLRCLSKDPQGRWDSTRDLVTELRRIELHPPSAASLALWKMRRLVRRPAVPIAAAVLAAGAALAWWQPWHQRTGRAAQAASGATPERPSFILVADFQGVGVKPELLVATRELVLASLAQSTLVTPFSRAQLQRALKQAQKPDSTRITGEVASELAKRGTAQAYIEGRIDGILNRYSVVLDVVLSDTRETLLTLSRVANSEDELIATLDKLGHDLREQLGERRDALRATTPLREAITPSFDAFSNYLHAIALQRETKYAGSNEALRQALRLDPDFAAARQQMAINYYNQSFLDSAQIAVKLALEKPDRLTDLDRLALQWFQEYALRYDLDTALQVSDAIMQQTKGPADRWGNRAAIVFDLGRYEEAIEAHLHLDEPSVSPFGVSSLQLVNRVHMLLQVGRVAEARAAAAKMIGPSQLLSGLEIAVCSGQWARADTLVAAVQGSTANKSQRYMATLTQWSLEARRGHLDAAAKGLRALMAEAPGAFYASLAQVALLQLGVATGNVPDPAQLGVAADTTVTGWIVRGMVAAAHGDSTAARHCRSAVAAGPGSEQRRHAGDATVLDGWIAAATNRPQEIVRLLDGARTSGRGPWVTGRVPSRWLVAQAFDHGGRLPEAVAAWDSVCSPRRLHLDVWTWFAFVEPFARREMARVEARSGHADAARAHLAALTALWPSPDATGAALLADTRRAVGASASPP